MKFSVRIQFEQHTLLSLPEKIRKSPAHWVVNQWSLQFQHPKVGLQERIEFFYCSYKNKRTVNTIEIVCKFFLCSFLIFCITKVTNQLCYFCYNYLSFFINNFNNLKYCIIHFSLPWIIKSNIDKITKDFALNFEDDK